MQYMLYCTLKYFLQKNLGNAKAAKEVFRHGTSLTFTKIHKYSSTCTVEVG